MELETPRLVLRHFNETDVDRWAQLIFADPEVMRYIPHSCLSPLERAQRSLILSGEHWQKQGFGLWAITLKPGGDLIGQGGLNKIPETGEIEVDYILAKPYWGQGYATEVAHASLWFGFEQIGLERVIGLVVPENRASRHVLEKIGMGFEKEIHLWGLDLCSYALDRHDYIKNNPLSERDTPFYQIH